MSRPDQEEWLRRLRAGGSAVAVAQSGSDAAFGRLDATIRAGYQAGRTRAELVTVSGLSIARVDEALTGTGPGGEEPYTDTWLRVAAYTAAASIAEWLAARGRRDALMLEAGIASGLSYQAIAQAAGTSRRYEWELRTGRLSVDRRSARQDVFEGSGIVRYRDTENERLRSKRAALKAGNDVAITHGLHGYRHGCRCDVCLAARRAVQAGTLETSHGLGGYRHGCRCGTCRTAHAEYHRKWRRGLVGGRGRGVGGGAPRKTKPAG